jgi:hypothetical protein
MWLTAHTWIGDSFMLQNDGYIKPAPVISGVRRQSHESGFVEQNVATGDNLP